MANLNLSQFGENTSVSDADYTFVWDSANSISKKVSRNSWLNSGTLTSDAPVTISQTWNAVGQTFKALVVNAAGTSDANSAAGSLLLDLQVGTVSQFSVSKDGQVNLKKLGNSVNASVVSYDSGGLKSGFYFPNSGLDLAWTRANGSVWGVGFNRCSVNSSARFSWSSSSDPLGTEDTILLRDGAANTLALRNGAAAQTFRVYGAYPDTGINYARLALSCDTSGNATISTQALGTYTAGTVSINGKNTIISSVKNSIGDTVQADSLWSSATVIGANGSNKFIIGFNTSIGTACFTGANSSLSAFAPTGIQGSQLQFYTGVSERMRIDAAGNVGIGTTSPTSKLQVSAGDVEVDTIAKGVILKSPDGTRYRVTVANGGTLSVAAV